MVRPKLTQDIELFAEYERVLKLQKRTERTIENKMWAIHQFTEFFKKPMARHHKDGNDFVIDEVFVMRADIERYAEYLQTRGIKKTSQDINIINLKVFFEWLAPKNSLFANVGLWEEEPDHSDIEWAKKEDVIAMLKHAKNQRDRCLLFLMWDTAGRIDEILNLKVGDIKFEDQYCKVTLNGKTGRRTVPITDSVPDLRDWLNLYKGTKSDWLFPSQKGGHPRRHWADQIIKYTAEKAGITKRIFCHSLRHGRLTELGDSGISEMKLRLFAGWSKRSHMPSVYINTEGKEMERAILAQSGVDVEDKKEKKVQISTAPKVCPKCGYENKFDAKYCGGCTFVLDPLTEMEMETETSNVLADVFGQLAKTNPGILASLLNAVKDIKS